RPRSRSLVLAGGLLLLVACARWRPEPATLPFPTPPAITFARCDTDKICLTEADAERLAKWMDQLRAFEAARARLLTD
ncbi:MAG TPA: hypothetical protein VLK35_01920, partial [Methylomirabilota bacterium]|nr:hypothetical protein [Methylomirabilota bacterium]